MKYKIVIILLLFVNIIFAQVVTIKGTVLDRKTNEPIDGASVYFDNTTIGTISKSDGSFNIEKDNTIKAALVISFLGYQKVVIDNPEPNKSYKVLIEEEAFSLDEVVITDDDWPRAIKLKEFRTHFLGTTRNGKSCKILNEDELILKFNKRTKILTATAYKSLKIINRNLNYTIDYDLQEFEVTYSYVNGISDRAYRSTFFVGTSFFQPLETELDSKIEKRRQKAYEGSVLHFMRSLSQQKLKESGYKVFNGGFETKAEKYITVDMIDSLDIYKISIAKDPKVVRLRNENPSINFGDRPIAPIALNILYKGNRQSRFEPNTREFYIDQKGNHFPANAISFSGDMSEGRFGNTLPLDYEIRD